MNWTQPICPECYAKREPGRDPVRMKDGDPETCCDCGELTTDGIYFRVDPRTVRHPTGGEEPFRNGGTWLVAVVRRDVLGEIGFHARCACGWESRGTSKDVVALKWAKQHGEFHARAAAAIAKVGA